VPAAAFAVEAVSEDELVVHLPDSIYRDPRFFHRLAAYLERDNSPSARLGRRDELVRQLAARFYTGSRRAVAMTLLAHAKHYETTRWKVDRRSVKCPPELVGTPRELLWHAFKSAPYFPTSARQIENIIR
jgi:hypothetical protein